MIDIWKFWTYPTNCSVEYPSTPCFHRDLNYPLHGESRLLMGTVNNNDNNSIPFKQSSKLKKNMTLSAHSNTNRQTLYLRDRENQNET